MTGKVAIFCDVVKWTDSIGPKLAAKSIWKSRQPPTQLEDPKYILLLELQCSFQFQLQSLLLFKKMPPYTTKLLWDNFIHAQQDGWSIWPSVPPIYIMLSSKNSPTSPGGLYTYHVRLQPTLIYFFRVIDTIEKG